MRSPFLIALLVSGFIGIFTWYTSTAGVCPVPLMYKVGSVDERFTTSALEVKSVATAAEAVWEDATGRDLFVYDEASPFTINLVYDERQLLANTEEEWSLKLDADKAAYETLLREVKASAARYESEEASYIKKRTEYESALAAYNAEVERYNETGGAPGEVYQRLQEEAAVLSEEAKALVNLESSLEKLASTINARGEEGNEMIVAYNNEVKEYNAMFGTKETFTQGDYERERINIYKFTNTEELRRVLVHEFGHALGIGHVEGETSVMYYLMTEGNPSALSSDDLAAFAAVCGEAETLSVKLRQFIRTALAHFN